MFYFGGYILDTKMITIGRDNFIPRARIIAFLFPDSLPIKRTISELRELNKVIDATRGKKTRSIIVLDNGFIVLSSVKATTLADKYDLNPGGKNV